MGSWTGLVARKTEPDEKLGIPSSTPSSREGRGTRNRVTTGGSESISLVNRGCRGSVPREGTKAPHSLHTPVPAALPLDVQLTFINPFITDL